MIETRNSYGYPVVVTDWKKVAHIVSWIVVGGMFWSFVIIAGTRNWPR